MVPSPTPPRSAGGASAGSAPSPPSSPDPAAPSRPVLTADDARRALRRLAHEVLESRKGAEGLVLVGIRRGGDHLAHELGEILGQIEGVKPPVGLLDTTLYRDDLGARADSPEVRQTRIDFDVTGRDVLLVDDVLYTGRTVRAALNALMDFGRPARVLLAVLVDRGHRELPIRPDFVGKNIPTEAGDRVEVRFTPENTLEGVVLHPKGTA